MGTRVALLSFQPAITTGVGTAYTAGAKTEALLASAPPDLKAPFCIGVMSDKERWAQIVKSVHFSESAMDNRTAMKRTVAVTLSKTCVYSVCNKKFASERASAAHAQRVHGYRTEWS